MALGLLGAPLLRSGARRRVPASRMAVRRVVRDRAAARDRLAGVRARRAGAPARRGRARSRGARPRARRAPLRCGAVGPCWARRDCGAVRADRLPRGHYAALPAARRAAARARRRPRHRASGARHGRAQSLGSYGHPRDTSPTLRRPRPRGRTIRRRHGALHVVAAFARVALHRPLSVQPRRAWRSRRSSTAASRRSPRFSRPAATKPSASRRIPGSATASGPRGDSSSRMDRGSRSAASAASRSGARTPRPRRADKGGAAVGVCGMAARAASGRAPELRVSELPRGALPLPPATERIPRPLHGRAAGELRRISLDILGQQFGGPSVDATVVGDAARDMYDGGVAYTDALLRRVVDALRDSGRLDRTILVVLADHGEILGGTAASSATGRRSISRFSACRCSCAIRRASGRHTRRGARLDARRVCHHPRPRGDRSATHAPSGLARERWKRWRRRTHLLRARRAVGARRACRP